MLGIWARFADQWWSRPENGGVPTGTVWPPANKGWLLNPTTSDLTVLRGSSPAGLALAFRRCGVEAVVMDGLEELFWPLYNVSPDA